MEASKRKASWLYLILLGLAAFVLSIIVVTVAATVYASVLAFQARGAPDGEAISSFASGFSSIGANAPLWLSALVVAFFGLRRRPGSPNWSGLVIGVVAGVPDLVLSGPLMIQSWLLFLLTSVAGSAGGWLGLRSAASGPAAVEPAEVPPP